MTFWMDAWMIHDIRTRKIVEALEIRKRERGYTFLLRNTVARFLVTPRCIISCFKKFHCVLRNLLGWSNVHELTYCQILLFTTFKNQFLTEHDSVCKVRKADLLTLQSSGKKKKDESYFCFYYKWYIEDIICPRVDMNFIFLVNSISHSFSVLTREISSWTRI